MRIKFVSAYLVAVIMTAGLVLLPANQAAAGFYKNKVVTIVIPFGPGGGYHLYASKLSKHIRKYIPDAPPFVLQFMPGAGGLKGANYFYSVAPSAGTHIALLSQTAALFQRLNKGKSGYRYDASKLNYIGRLVSMDAAHMFFKSFSLRFLRKKEPVTRNVSVLPSITTGTARSPAMPNSPRRGPRFFELDRKNFLS